MTNARAEGAHWIAAADESSLAAAEMDHNHDQAKALASAQVEALIAIYWELRHGNDLRAAQRDTPPHAG